MSFTEEDKLYISKENFNMEIVVVGWKEGLEARKNIISEVFCIMNEYFGIKDLGKYSLKIQNISCADNYCQKNLPCAHPDRTKICITVADNDWLMFIYQVSHELCHWVTSRGNLPQSLKWFDEFICCLSSWVVFYHIKIYGNSYLASLYTTDIKQAIMTYMGQILLYMYPNNVISVQNTKEFFNHNFDLYIKDENLIKLHDVYYLSLCHLLNYDFKGLTFIGKLHNIKTYDGMSIKNYLLEARKLCNDDEKAVINIISDIFGFDLKYKEDI